MTFGGGLGSPAAAASPLASPQPVVAEGAEPGQRFTVLDAVRGFLAANDVVRMAHRRPLDLDVPGPRFLERLDTVEHEVEVERPVLELDEVLAAPYLLGLGLRQ